MSRTVHIPLRFDDASSTSDHAPEREYFAFMVEPGITAYKAWYPEQCRRK